MLNGRSFKGEIGRTTGGIISINLQKKKGKTKLIQLSSYRIYSYVKGGEATTIYRQDELQGNFLSEIEARNATMGMYDARVKVKPRYVFWTSFALGLATTLFDNYRLKPVLDIDSNVIIKSGWFKSNVSFFPFLVPPVVTGIWAIPKFRVRPKQMLHKQFENDPHYYRGFNRIHRQKRILYSLRGGALGVLTGLVTYFIFR
ncbi:hypothetical protein JYT74_00485 [Crocinitomix catalasitica]|nr:hypothetical protein [Crocinitomix catalasitica]